jgi:cobalt-zinc-cadmium efflux system protein
MSSDNASAPGASEFSNSIVNHEFEHSSDPIEHGRRRALGWALGVNVALLIVEVIGGFIFGSLALLADAVHLVSDVAGLGIALVGVTLAARQVSLRHSFGFARAEVLAAQISALLLLAAGGGILFEGVTRFRNPAPVEGAGLAGVAAVGLIVNLGSAILLHKAQGESLNMRASFVHLATDAVGSFGAIVAGLLIWGWGWDRADSIVSIGVAALVIWTGWSLLLDAIHVLMEGTPRGMDIEKVRSAILDVRSIIDVHHMHLWNLASDVPAFSAHVVVEGEPSLRDSGTIADQIKSILGEEFGLAHITLEMECEPVSVESHIDSNDHVAIQKFEAPITAGAAVKSQIKAE